MDTCSWFEKGQSSVSGRFYPGTPSFRQTLIVPRGSSQQIEAGPSRAVSPPTPNLISVPPDTSALVQPGPLDRFPVIHAHS